jgi:hypothetical protein
MAQVTIKLQDVAHGANYSIASREFDNGAAIGCDVTVAFDSRAVTTAVAMAAFQTFANSVIAG